MSGQTVTARGRPKRLPCRPTFPCSPSGSRSRLDTAASVAATPSNNRWGWIGDLTDTQTMRDGRRQCLACTKPTAETSPARRCRWSTSVRRVLPCSCLCTTTTPHAVDQRPRPRTGAFLDPEYRGQVAGDRKESATSPNRPCRARSPRRPHARTGPVPGRGRLGRPSAGPAPARTASRTSP